MLIAAPHVSDQSLLLVAHWGERRCDGAFLLPVSPLLARRCSSLFRFYIGRVVRLSVPSENFSDDVVLRRGRSVRRLLTYRSSNVFFFSTGRHRLQRLSLL